MKIYLAQLQLLAGLLTISSLLAGCSSDQTTNLSQPEQEAFTLNEVSGEKLRQATEPTSTSSSRRLAFRTR